jgi:UDPglucose 6-dehydrogenase
VLGLTFKSGTNDVRDSPALAVAALLRQAGAELVGYDPVLSADGGDGGDGGDGQDIAGVSLVDDPYLAAKDTDALVLLTEWPEFRSLDWARLAEAAREPVVVDTRNLLDADVARRGGYEWIGLGRRAAAA